MRAVVHSFCSRSWSRAAVIGMVAAGLAGCSAESTRFSQGPYANPYASKQAAAPNEVTGSVGATNNRITAQPLPPPPTANRPETIAATGVSGGGQGMGSFNPASVPPTRPAASGHDITGSVARPAQPQAPAPAVKNTPASAPSVVGANVHIVAPGETLMSISRLYKKSVAEIAGANKIAPHTLVKIGDRLVIPGKVTVNQPAMAAPKVQPAAPAPGASPKVAAVEPAPTARIATPAPQAATEVASTASAGAPSFRWPVRGRVIAGFGPKGGGQQNDGINLAVPEGTAIRASEDGVVAYAGSELKGYGNLILIRHANGFVTAYAHASELMVKRNDQVRRGQIIAKSGQTGTVTSPQLHFEIRKGSAPVDPTQYLPAGA